VSEHPPCPFCGEAGGCVPGHRCETSPPRTAESVEYERRARELIGDRTTVDIPRVEHERDLAPLLVPPAGLCNVGGCVFMLYHGRSANEGWRELLHSWQR
jgi:hypothetical protein